MKAGIRNSTTLIISVCICILSTPVLAVDIPGVDQILDRYIEEIGGRDAIEKLECRICIGKETTDLTSRDKPIYEALPFESYSRIPDHLYMETWSDTEIYRRGYDGKDSWVRDKCGVKRIDYIGKDRMAWLLNPHNALVIEDYFPDLEVVGTEWVRGKEVYFLESPELHRPLYFDIESGLLIGFGHNWEIHDYRETDGVLFPHRIHISRKGGSTVFEFDKIIHNQPIPDSLFAIPSE